jgi:formylglycine-generating enzyme required for sulfatase activity
MVRSGQWCVSLSSELEWEKAARSGNADRIFPWGDTANSNLANYFETSINGTSSVGCFPANDFGCYDMIGNALEWTRSRYSRFDPNDRNKETQFNYPYVASDGREQIDAPDKLHRVSRGGSWGLKLKDARCAARADIAPASHYLNMGFRIVLSPCVSSPPLISGEGESSQAQNLVESSL